VRSRSLRRDYGTLSELIAVGGAGGGDFPSPVVPNPSWLQANWYVNPVTGNDSASGTSPATAVKTIVGGIVARWGTTAPTLAQNTTIFLLESETIDQEYVVLEPVLVGAVSFAIIGTFAAVGTTFKPASVASKNRATPQLLQLHGMPAGTTGGQLVLNETKGSYAFVDSVTAGVATMTQPFVSAGLTSIDLTAIPAEDDSWTSADTYQRYAVPLLNLKYLAPVGGDTNTSVSRNVCWVQGVHVPDVSGTPGFSNMNVNSAAGCSVVCSLCWFDPEFVGLANNATVGQSFSCWNNGGVVGYSWAFLGGASNTNGGYFLDGTYVEDLSAIDGDIIIHGGLTVKGAYSLCGYAYLDASAGSTIAGSQLRIEPYYYAVPQLWGPGGMDVDGGGALINESGTTWAACMTLSGSLTIGGITTGTKYAAGVWTDGVTISAANLDTFGGLINPQTTSRYCSAA
jgi:hypothetical protein